MTFSLSRDSAIIQPNAAIIPPQKIVLSLCAQYHCRSQNEDR